MTNRIERFIGRLLHRGGSDQGSPLCFYDILHRRWIHLPLGQHVSLVGSTGAGKSNLIADLLLNLRPEVDSGTALIYGIDLKKRNRTVTLRQLSGRPRHRHGRDPEHARTT